MIWESKLLCKRIRLDYKIGNWHEFAKLSPGRSIFLCILVKMTLKIVIKWDFFFKYKLSAFYSMAICLLLYHATIEQINSFEHWICYLYKCFRCMHVTIGTNSIKFQNSQYILILCFVKNISSCCDKNKMIVNLK